MSIAKKYNKGKRFSIDTTGWDKFFSLKELFTANGPDHVYGLNGCFVSEKGNYGPSPVFVSDGFFVNAPAHLLNDVKEILADDESIAQIEEGKAGFRIYEYEQTKYKRRCFGVEFVDL